MLDEGDGLIVRGRSGETVKGGYVWLSCGRLKKLGL